MSDVRELVPVLPPGATVKLVGLGGVGSIVARYLVVFLRALDLPVRVVLIDGDEFGPENAARMLFGREGKKALVVREALLGALEGTRVTLDACAEYVTPESLPRLIRSGDIVLLLVDNHATRKLVSEHCAGLDDVCLLSGGNDGAGPDSTGRVLRGTYGNVQAQLRRGGEELCPTLDRYHPEIAEPADRRPDEQDCAEAMVSTPQILFANLQTASALLSTLWLHCCGALHYSELCFDVFDARMAPSGLPSPRTGASQKLGPSR